MEPFFHKHLSTCEKEERKSNLPKTFILGQKKDNKILIILNFSKGFVN